MTKPTDRDLERAYTRAQFAAKLRRLADALESGRPFTIQVGGERLRIPADASFNVEHEREAGEEELEFQLQWRTAGQQVRSTRRGAGRAARAPRRGRATAGA